MKDTSCVSKQNRAIYIGGFSLLETIVAVSILMITIVGPLYLAAKGIAFANYVKDEITAFSLAQETVEAIRNIRDTNIRNNRSWLNGISQCIGEGSSNACRIDIWSYANADRGVEQCGGSCVDEADRTAWERLKVVDVGVAPNAIRLYGYGFNESGGGNIIPAGQTPIPSIFSRRIIIRNVTQEYLDNGTITPSEKSLLKLNAPEPDEIYVQVEVRWQSGSIERHVTVSENMFSI